MADAPSVIYHLVRCEPINRAVNLPTAWGGGLRRRPAPPLSFAGSASQWVATATAVEAGSFG